MGEEIFAHPELGYKETRTADLVESKFRQMGARYRSSLAITGVKARLPGSRCRASVGILGELDAVLCHDHPSADPQTGAVHACGHNAQIAALIGAGFGLVDSGVMGLLDGDVVLLAVPAEEYVELEFRQRLREDGRIRFFGGKQELIYRGEMDDLDLAMICHSESNTPERKARVGGSSNGFLGKLVRYLGKEAHAGGAPHEGVNALNAAVLGMMGINAQRETFRDEDSIRVHPIITKGGDLVNIVPADVRLETYVRAKTVEAIMGANEKVNRALKAGAMAVGAEVTITDVPGYLPLENEPGLTELFRANLADLIGSENILAGQHMAGSTDMGDVTHLMPAIHPSCGGVRGRAHTRDFQIVDPEMAYLIPAKALAMTAIDLLADDARLARQILAGFQPRLTKDEYLKLWEKLLA